MLRHTSSSAAIRVALLMAMTVSSAVVACMCIEPSIRQAYRSARTVIVAVVEAPVPGPGRYARVPLRSVQWFKGKRKVEWVDATFDEPCGFDTVEGLEYVLFLDENQVAHGCAGSHQVKAEDRAEVVRELRRIK